MLALHLRAADLAETSLTVSPLFETVLSLRAWTSPNRHRLHEPWRRRVLTAWQQCDTEMLTALVSPDGRIPDFLAPRPPTESPAFDDEIAVVGATPAVEMRRDVSAAFSADVPSILTGPARAVRTRTVQALSQYWATCLQPGWARIRASWTVMWTTEHNSSRTSGHGRCSSTSIPEFDGTTVCCGSIGWRTRCGSTSTDVDFH